MTKLILKNEHRFGPPRICAKIGVFADSHFPRLILSRAAATPARDKINLGNWVPVRVPPTKVVPDGAGAGSADSSSGKCSFGGTLACKYCRSGRTRSCKHGRSGPLSCRYRRRNSAAGLCRSSSRAAGDANRPHGRPLVPAAQPAGAHSASRHYAPEGRAPRSGRSGGDRCGAEEAGTLRWKPVEAGAGGPFKAVTRYEPTESGPKRPFHGRKRGGPC